MNGGVYPRVQARITAIEKGGRIYGQTICGGFVGGARAPARRMQHFRRRLGQADAVVLVGELGLFACGGAVLADGQLVKQQQSIVRQQQYDPLKKISRNA